MPYVFANGIRLAYERSGHGDRVLMIMGQGAGGNVWSIHQVPALVQSGYEVITFDNRGIPPSDVPPGDYSLADLVTDTEQLIEALNVGPCRLVGASLGAAVATELAVRRPDLVISGVLMAMRARTDAFRQALSDGEQALWNSGIELPPAYGAANSVLSMFSPATLNNDKVVSMWLDVYEMSVRRKAARGQNAIDLTCDRRDALRAVPVPCRVIGFANDLTCPPHLCAEVADVIPDCDYLEIDSCGHAGYLEQPEQVNAAVIEFFKKN